MHHSAATDGVVPVRLCVPPPPPPSRYWSVNRDAVPFSANDIYQHNPCDSAPSPSRRRAAWADAQPTRTRARARDTCPVACLPHALWYSSEAARLPAVGMIDRESHAVVVDMRVAGATSCPFGSRRTRWRAPGSAPVNDACGIAGGSPSRQNGTCRASLPVSCAHAHSRACHLHAHLLVTGGRGHQIRRSCRLTCRCRGRRRGGRRLHPHPVSFPRPPAAVLALFAATLPLPRPPPPRPPHKRARARAW